MPSRPQLDPLLPTAQAVRSHGHAHLGGDPGTIANAFAEQVTELVQAVSVPVNVTAHPVDGHGAGSLSALTELGARRITFGPLWQKWLTDVSSAQLAQWVAPE